MYRMYVAFGDVNSRNWPEDGKAYSLEDLLRFDRPYREEYYREVLDVTGITDAWQIRVCEPKGVAAFLSVAGKTGRVGESAPELLQSIAPALQSSVRGYVAAKAARLEALLTSEAVRRLQYGWVLLEQDGYVMASDPFGEAFLANSDVLGRNNSGRLTVSPIKLEREIMKYLGDLAGPQSRPRALTLRTDPWLDMLLVPVRQNMISDTARPSAVAYIHRDNWASVDRREQLIDLFGLSPSEARLALALCRGKALAEAAAELEITVETARSYSKSIYAKTGTRGMVDLVRVIMGSVLALTPDR